MARIYLLLRNNRQLGPLTLDELMSQQLSVSDLIWVEGRSASWRNPGEIEAIAALMPKDAITPVSLKNVAVDGAVDTRQNSRRESAVFVSMPHQNSVIKPAISSETVREIQDPSLQHQQALDELETNYTDWIAKTKIKARPARPDRRLVTSALIVIAIGAAIVLYQAQKKSAPQRANNISTGSPAPQNVTAVGDSDENVRKTESDPVSVTQSEKSFTSIPSKVPANSAAKKQRSVHHPASVIANDIVTATTIQAQTGTAVGQKSDDQPSQEIKTEPAVTKEKLGQKLKKLFQKKKDEVRPDEDVTPPTAADRNSKKRQSGSMKPLPDPDAVMANISVDFTTANDWMMGVQGLRITVRNRNAAAVKSGVVHVRYFDQAGKLLTEKNITFGKVRANDKLEIAGADHPTADHVTVNVLSVRLDDDKVVRL